MNNVITVLSSSNSSVLDISTTDSSSKSETNDNTDNERYYEIVIDNQKTMIENSEKTIAYLHLMSVVLVVFFTVFLALKFGRMIHNSIN